MPLRRSSRPSSSRPSGSRVGSAVPAAAAAGRPASRTAKPGARRTAGRTKSRGRRRGKDSGGTSFWSIYWMMRLGVGGAILMFLLIYKVACNGTHLQEQGDYFRTEIRQGLSNYPDREYAYFLADTYHQECLNAAHKPGMGLDVDSYDERIYAQHFIDLYQAQEENPDPALIQRFKAQSGHYPRDGTVDPQTGQSNHVKVKHIVVP